jgi:hypothetical protein
MKSITEIIWPKGKAVAKFNSEGGLVVGTYFAPDDQPHEIFPKGIKQAQNALGIRRRLLGWGSRSLEITAGVILGKTIADAIRSSEQDSLKETGLAIGKITVASAAEVGSVWLRERQKSIDRKLAQVEKLANAVPQEPKPQS